MFRLKIAAAAFALAAPALLAAPAWAESTVLTNVTVIDGTGKAAQPNSAIVMTDGKIAFVGPMAQLKAPAGEEKVGGARRPEGRSRGHDLPMRRAGQPRKRRKTERGHRSGALGDAQQEMRADLEVGRAQAVPDLDPVERHARSRPAE